ncbi:MAG: LysR substrate-binding domain-containing protein [Burkholderiaceae bacterium]
MNLRQLEYFVRVAELGSFTRASHALGVAQPALSRQVRALEVEVRQSLLVRNGRGVSTTAAGRLMLEHGRGILHQVERLTQELDQARDAPVGRIALGLPPTLSKLLAVSLIRAFRERLPAVVLSIAEGLSVTMLGSIADGRLDLAVVYNPIASPELELHPLPEERLYLIERRGIDDAGPHGAPIALADLVDRPLVIPSRPNALRMQVDSGLAQRGLAPSIALETDGVNAILELVADGVGAAVLAGSTVRTLGADPHFVSRPIVDPPLAARLALVSSARRPASPALRAAIELLCERIVGQLGDGNGGNGVRLH